LAWGLPYNRLDIGFDIFMAETDLTADLHESNFALMSQAQYVAFIYLKQFSHLRNG
jgi:hypothetical protein